MEIEFVPNQLNFSGASWYSWWIHNSGILNFCATATKISSQTGHQIRTAATIRGERMANREETIRAEELSWGRLSSLTPTRARIARPDRSSIRPADNTNPSGRRILRQHSRCVYLGAGTDRRSRSCRRGASCRQGASSHRRVIGRANTTALVCAAAKPRLGRRDREAGHFIG
jgi:hypothetical protein